MRSGLSVLLIFFPFTLLIGQKAGLPEQVKTRATGSNSPARLAYELTSSHTNDRQKAYAIFRWITENIDYRVKNSYQRRRVFNVNPDAEEDTAALKCLDERVAETVLENRLAVCDGYSRLFKTLCSYAGIRAELITGYARTEPGKISSRFRSNHTWNAVWLDSSWHLVDVTWGSGFLNWGGNEFIRRIDDRYFMAHPRDFIQDHLPEDPAWTLMEDPPVLIEFRHSPFKQKNFIKYSISSFKPSKGIIKAELGDTLHFELKVADPETDKLRSPDPFFDINYYNNSSSVVLTPTIIDPGTYIYSYIISSPDIRWINLLYNEDLVLRYCFEQIKK